MKLLVNIASMGLRTVRLPHRVDMHAAAQIVSNMYPGDATMIVRELS